MGVTSKKKLVVTHEVRACEGFRSQKVMKINEVEISENCLLSGILLHRLNKQNKQILNMEAHHG